MIKWRGEATMDQAKLARITKHLIELHHRVGDMLARESMFEAEYLKDDLEFVKDIMRHLEKEIEC